MTINWEQFTVSIVSILAVIVLYTLQKAYFGALSRFPGQWLWRTFRFPQLYAMVSGELPYRLDQFHQKYGTAVRVAPNEISFTEPDAWKDIYGKKHFIRPDEWRSRLPGKNAHHFISADVPTHSRFRRVFAAAFSETALRRQEPLIQGHIDKMLSRIEEAIDCQNERTKKSATIDVVKLFNFTAFDIIGDLGWGRSFNCLDTMQYHPFINVVQQFKMTMVVAAFKYYPWLDRFITAITPASALESIKVVTDTAEENVKARLELGSDRPDIMSYAKRHHVAGHDVGSKEHGDTYITTEELETNSMAFIVAGSDTMTTALAGTVNCLLQSPAALSRVVDEIRGAFESEADITATKTQSLQYLRAVIDEGLRCRPPVPDIMRRKVSADNHQVAGRFIPQGTIVGVSMFATFRSDRNFVRPRDFCPERWLQEGAAEFKGDRKAAYQPFSTGPTGCIGYNLARMELRLILARLFWRFDIGSPEGETPLKWDSQKIYWSWDKQPVATAFTRRL